MRGEVNKLKILLALIVIFQGLTITTLADPLVTYTHPAMRLFGVFLMAAGILYLYFKYKEKQAFDAKKAEKAEKEAMAEQKLSKSTQFRLQMAHKKGGKKPEPEKPEPEEKSILIRFMEKIFKRAEKLSNYSIPIIGALIIDAVIIYNIWQHKSIDLHGFDAITIAFGVSLIVYNYIPAQFSYGRDFLVFFLGLVFFILIFPPIFYNLIFGSGGTAVVTKYLLADPVVGILNLGGIDSTVEMVGSGDSETATVFFPLAQTGDTASVGIAEGCSGIYTASIFLSAFITFILLEYKRFDGKVGLLIGLGIFTSYIANIFRMTIIIVVSHLYDTDPGNLVNLSWVHINAGWLIFLAWIIPFWYLMYRYLMKKDISGHRKKGAVEVDV